MLNHKLKLFRNDEEARSQKSHYTHVSKTSSKNVELSLEVEMDDEVREIIKSPEKRTSALLDVTVIKPKGLDKYSTEKQILKTEQVKNMIASMNLESSYKKTLMEKLFGEMGDGKQKEGHGERKGRSPRVPRDHEKGKSCLSSKVRHNLDQGDVRFITDDTRSAVYSTSNQPLSTKGGLKTQQQQIYTSPRTYENIRSMFECTKKENQHKENEKMEQPCMCQNCAIVGILTDSQKKPFATEPMPDPVTTREPRYRRPGRRKSVTFKHAEDFSPSTSKPHEHEQCQAIFQLLSSRINELEKRVAMQEEKAVPKDYFKKIITKLVTHLTKLTHYSTEERSMASSHRHKDQPQSYTKYRPSEKHGRYYVNPVLVETGYKTPAEKEYDPKPCSSEEPPESPSEGIWKWGEEFLTSGRDLKNKVVVLLEETLHNLKKGWEKQEIQGRSDDDMQTMVQDLTRNLAHTLRPKSARNKSPPYQDRGRKVSNISEDKPGSTSDKKSPGPSLIPRFMRKKGPTVNIAYVNPRLQRWTEESTVSFKIDSSSYDLQKEMTTDFKKKQYKKEFLKVLTNTKTADKFKLWQNIWNQALENGQTKKDIVTIQIPDPKDLVRQKMIHLDYTIEELEKLLTCARKTADKEK